VKSSLNQPVIAWPSTVLVVHVGGAADLVLVAVDEHPVLGQHQVRLDEVGALGDGQPIA